VTVHTLDAGDRQRLLDLARRALEARVRGLAPPQAVPGGALDAPLGAFVTLHARGELRGCLGRLDPTDALPVTVAHLAAAVADSDPRFPPVRAVELPEIAIEISVLTPAHAVSSVDEIDIGRHGLIVEDGARRGLLLPQVASEHGWSPLEFVEHACVKAGLPRDAWRHAATLSVFEAEVFADG